MTLLEGLDTDPAPFGQASERCYESLVDDPLSRSRTACGVAPKFGLSRSLCTSVLPGPVSSPFKKPRSHSPLPTPGGHAGGEIHLLQAPTSGEQCGAKEQGRANDRSPEPQKDGALSHPNIL